MSKKMVTYAVTLAMMFSIFCLPAAVHGADGKDPQVAKTTGAKAKATSGSTIKLTWGAVSGADGYAVYRYNSKKKQYKELTTTSQTSYTDKKLKGNTTYRYKVRAYAEVNGVTYYGDYSAATKTKTKKSDSQKVVAKAKAKIGARYRSGGSGPKSFDCSGFVYWVYKNADVDAKKKVKRTSSAGLYSSLKKYKVGSSIKSIKKAKAGDIILFKRGGRYSHAAIYAGSGKIIHAANARKGVCAQSVKQLNNSGTRVAAIIRVVE
ncbi:NlpC/P60 family protein [Eubacteriales bacterium DFI.9.88]|nr:NlpC/P60 family protein [Eubacteriales bacterium DFI.9.88]